MENKELEEDFYSDCDNCTTAGHSEILRLLYKRYPVNDWKRFGFFDDSFVTSIQPHWFSFEPPSANVHFLFAVIYTIFMVIGITGNLLVMALFSRCRSLRTPANYLILNLALSDFLLLCEIPIFIFNSFHRGPAIGSAGCQLYGFIGGLTGTVSIMTLSMIAIDRYFAIVHPMNPLKKTTKSRAVLVIIFVWVYSLIFASIPIFSSLEYVPEGLLTSCSFDYLSSTLENRIFIFVYFLAAWLFPLTIIVFSYLAIFRMVVKAEKFCEFEQDGNSRKTHKSRQREKLRKELRIAVITTVIIVVWLLAWTPYAIVALMGIFGQRHLITPIVSAIPACFCKTASCIDPFIYSLSHPRFQREIVKLKIMTSCVKARRRRKVSKDTISSQYCSVTYARSEEEDESIRIESDLNYLSLQRMNPSNPGYDHVATDEPADLSYYDQKRRPIQQRPTHCSSVKHEKANEKTGAAAACNMEDESLKVVEQQQEPQQRRLSLPSSLLDDGGGVISTTTTKAGYSYTEAKRNKRALSCEMTAGNDNDDDECSGKENACFLQEQVSEASSSGPDANKCVVVVRKAKFESFIQTLV